MTGRDTRLVERETEVGMLDGLAARAAAGRAGLAVVEGPAGIGKSRLLAELRGRARARGLRELTARGGELERDFPFGVVRQLFEPALAPDGARERLLTGAAAAARPVFESVERAPADDRGDVTFAALHGLFWLAADMADEAPLLVTVDDLHWCDRPSLRFLAYLARRLDGLPVLLALGLRTADPGTDPALVAELAAAPEAVAIRPGPLGPEGVAALAGARLGGDVEPAFAAACLAASGGNPLLLDQLLLALADDRVTPGAAGADAVRRAGARAASRTVLARLRRLPPEATAVARALAVLGDGAGLPVLAALAEMDEGRAAAAMEALARAEILRAEPPLGFAHPLVRDAVYHELPPGSRELHHSAAARALAAAGAPAEQVATQLLAAPRRGDPWAAEVLAAAAASARHRGAADSAVAHLTRALEEPPPADRRGPLRLELGLAAAAVDGPLAARHLAAALGELTDPRERAVAAGALARCLLFTGPPGEAVAVARRAADEAPPDLEDLRHGLEAVAALGIAFGADAGGDGPDAWRRVPRRIEGPGARALAGVAAWDRALTGGEAGPCAALALDALAGGALMAGGDAVGAGTAVAVLVLAERDEALAALDAMEAEGFRHGSHFAVNTAHYFRGGAWLARGELADAEAALRRAMEVAGLWGDVTWEEAALARVLVERGDLAAARALLDGAVSHAPRSVPAHGLRRARLELLLAEGRTGEALDVANEYAAHLGRIVNPAFAPWRSLTALALDRAGRTAEAVALAREELAPARRWGAPGAVGRSLRVLGALEREEGLDHLHEAAGLLEGSPARLEHARALLALGSALRRAGRRRESRPWLLRALELAGRCGAARDAEAARTELYAAGARPRAAAMAGPGALTASERRVAALAAEGHTNKAIAQALFVTLKTVEVHLSHVYRKLGITSRRGLGAALAPSGSGGEGSGVDVSGRP
jgi:DNA-binding CsgD family transcriptional regulator